MNKIINLSSITIFFIFFSTLILANDKVAIINIAKILKYMPQREKIEKILQNEFQSRFYDLQNKEKFLRKKIKNLAKEKIKKINNKKKEIEIIKEKRHLYQMIQNFEKYHNKRYNEERNKILKTIKILIINIVKKKNIHILIDINSIIYVDKKKDITKDLIKLIKASLY